MLFLLSEKSFLALKGDFWIDRTVVEYIVLAVCDVFVGLVEVTLSLAVELLVQIANLLIR